MKRPSIPFKPPAPSIHTVSRRLVERDRLLAIEKGQWDEAKLVAEIERDLGLLPGTLARHGPLPR